LRWQRATAATPLWPLIVLGESIIAVSAGTARSDRALDSAATAGLSFGLAAALW
jgi:hypothetical protein